MDAKELEELGFEAFEIGESILHAKDFPAVGYTLCTTEHQTFSISEYPDGDVIINIDMDLLKVTNAVMQQTENKICIEKSNMLDMINGFCDYKKLTEGESH